ncbi:hypothetical protein SAMN04487939_103121 [Lysobacter sp. yr284]|uniref:hypothetical protein n=1 Tax=Lysobacter sp. yr284 TaxID=1761791 RepID=UPI000897188E|nr:hypothetical protein [Lysobacter sp. yr284]SDY54799.1 hypothetical protein SAMN04487939_103121 [Lysobacter sp. yr284]
MKQLAHYRDDDEVPVANGFLFADGTVFAVDAVAIRALPQSLPIRHDAATWLDEATPWTATTAVATAVDADAGLIAIAGEGAMGADGFVALCDLRSRALKWLLFLDFSNPFETVEFAPGRIVASNNLHERWSIPIDARDAIEVAPLRGR